MQTKTDRRRHRGKEAEPLLYPVETVREMLGGIVSTQTIRNWFNEGRLSGVRVGRYLMIHAGSVQDLIANGIAPGKRRVPLDRNSKPPIKPVRGEPSDMVLHRAGFVRARAKRKARGGTAAAAPAP